MDQLHEVTGLRPQNTDLETELETVTAELAAAKSNLRQQQVVSTALQTKLTEVLVQHPLTGQLQEQQEVMAQGHKELNRVQEQLQVALLQLEEQQDVIGKLRHDLAASVALAEQGREMIVVESLDNLLELESNLRGVCGEQKMFQATMAELESQLAQLRVESARAMEEASYVQVTSTQLDKESRLVRAQLDSLEDRQQALDKSESKLIDNNRQSRGIDNLKSDGISASQLLAGSFTCNDVGNLPRRRMSSSLSGLDRFKSEVQNLRSALSVGDGPDSPSVYPLAIDPRTCGLQPLSTGLYVSAIDLLANRK